jgi:hypothetical protein
MAAQAQEVALAAPGFDATAWLAALVQIGGGYALASGRKLWLVVEDCDHDDLAAVMRPLIGNPDRAEAIRDAIERRSFGEGVA